MKRGEISKVEEYIEDKIKRKVEETLYESDKIKYEEIKKVNPDKDDEWIFKVYIREKGKYKIKESRANIKSYELIKMISSDIPFSLEELEHLPSSLYDFSKTEIKDISAFTDNNFILNQPKDKKKNEVEHTYFYADT